MKHNVNIPPEDLERMTQNAERVIDKITDSAIKIIAAYTAAQIVKSIFKQRTP